MPELIAKSALDGRRLTLGTVTLAEADPGPITSIAVLPGQAKSVAKGLKTVGLSFPAPNEFIDKKGLRIVWTGREQAFVIGCLTPPVIDGAALTDQSDGWTTLALSGAGAVDVLSRLAPIDLRLTAFPVGRALRTGLNHMNAVILRTGDHSFEIMVFRSMARTAWHEMETTMSMVSARQAVKI